MHYPSEGLRFSSWICLTGSYLSLLWCEWWLICGSSHHLPDNQRGWPLLFGWQRTLIISLNGWCPHTTIPLHYIWLTSLLVSCDWKLIGEEEQFSFELTGKVLFIYLFFALNIAIWPLLNAFIEMNKGNGRGVGWSSVLPRQIISKKLVGMTHEN